MPELEDDESVEVKGSGSSVYTLRNTGGIYSCTCPAWMHQSIGIERRTCKHLRAYRGDAAETERVGREGPAPRASSASASGDANAPPVLLAHKWETDVDLTGWWMSEKLDGVRAWWDGQQLLSRLGNVLHAPDWFVAGLPPRAARRRAVGGAQGLPAHGQRRAPAGSLDAWREVRLLLFDAPTATGGFEERLAWLADGAATWGVPHTSAPTRTSAAAAPTTSAPSSPASRPSAARG
jgi:DNA ligase-1